jgi:hypothetical protein
VSRARLYAVAFGSFVAAVVILGVAVAGFLESTGLLFLSAVLSGLAIVAAVGSVLVHR